VLDRMRRLHVWQFSYRQCNSIGLSNLLQYEMFGDKRGRSPHQQRLLLLDSTFCAAAQHCNPPNSLFLFSAFFNFLLSRSPPFVSPQAVRTVGWCTRQMLRRQC
jgi:hypothetical protein